MAKLESLKAWKTVATFGDVTVEVDPRLVCLTEKTAGRAPDVVILSRINFHLASQAVLADAKKRSKRHGA